MIAATCYWNICKTRCSLFTFFRSLLTSSTSSNRLIITINNSDTIESIFNSRYEIWDFIFV